MTRYPWVWEENGIAVYRHKALGWSVFRPVPSGTHSVTDSVYSRLDLAICRGLYLARGAAKGQASEAMALARNLEAR